MFSWQIAEGVKPTLAELEKFEDTPEGAEVECRLHLLVHSKIICKINTMDTWFMGNMHSLSEEINWKEVFVMCK